MRNPVTVLSALLSVEFVLYTICLCAPQWLVQREGTSKGLFALCNSYEGFYSCTMFPAWVGTYSLSWMFLAGSCALSLVALLTVRPALARGTRAIPALILNITSVDFCAAALIAFLVSNEGQMPQLLKNLGWTFYICCVNLLYALVVSVLLGLVHGDTTRVQPTTTVIGVDLPVIEVTSGLAQ